MLSIIIGLIVVFGLGMLWYGPLFGKQYRTLVGADSTHVMTDAEKKAMTFKMIIAGAVNLLTVGVVYALGPQSTSFSFIEFLGAVLMFWLGFGFPIQLGAYLWENKSWKLVGFNAIYSIVSFTLLSAVIYFI